MLGAIILFAGPMIIGTGVSVLGSFFKIKGFMTIAGFLSFCFFTLPGPGWLKASAYPEYGWGLFALPAFLGGLLLGWAIIADKRGYVVYLLSWAFFACFIALPEYLNQMDGLGGYIAYLNGGGNGPVYNVKPFVEKEIWNTTIFLLLLVALLVFPVILAIVSLAKTRIIGPVRFITLRKEN